MRIAAPGLQVDRMDQMAQGVRAPSFELRIMPYSICYEQDGVRAHRYACLTNANFEPGEHNPS